MQNIRKFFCHGIVLCSSLLLVGCSKQTIELISIEEQPSAKSSETATGNRFNWLPLGGTVVTNVPLGTPEPLLASTEVLQISSRSGAAAISSMFAIKDPLNEAVMRGPLVIKHDGELNFRCKFQCLDKSKMAPAVLDIGIHTVQSGLAAGEPPRGEGYRLQIPLNGGYAVLVKEFSGSALASDSQNIYRLGGEMGGQIATLDDKPHDLHFRLQITNRTVLISSYLDGVLLTTGVDTPEMDGKHDEPGNFTSFNAMSIAVRGDVNTKLSVVNVALAANEILPAVSEKIVKFVKQGMMVVFGSVVLLFLFWLGWKTGWKANPSLTQ